MLCHALPPLASAPDRAARAAPAPGEDTVTLVTLPWVAVTVMPAAGSASRLPSAGVIFRSAAACAAWADAAAEADAAAWAGVCGVPAAGRGEQADGRRCRDAGVRPCPPAAHGYPPWASGVWQKRPYYVLLTGRRRRKRRSRKRSVTAQPRAGTVASTSTYSGHAPTRSASVR